MLIAEADIWNARYSTSKGQTLVFVQLNKLKSSELTNESASAAGKSGANIKDKDKDKSEVEKPFSSRNVVSG